MKTEVYSWRVSTEIKTSLERAARRHKVSLSAVLDMAAKEWLAKSAGEMDDEERQRGLHEAASQCIGTIAGRNPRRSETVRDAVRERLRRRHVR
jgi:hypothetical protein